MVTIPAIQIKNTDKIKITLDSKKNEWDLQTRYVEQAMIWIVVFHLAKTETSSVIFILYVCSLIPVIKISLNTMNKTGMKV